MDAAIAEVEAENGTKRTGPPDLPADLRGLSALHERIAQAAARLDEGRTTGNVTDPGAHQMTARGVNRPAYHARPRRPRRAAA